MGRKLFGKPTFQVVHDEGHFIQPIVLWVVTGWHNGLVAVVQVLGDLLVAVSGKHFRDTGHLQEPAVASFVIL